MNNNVYMTKVKAQEAVVRVYCWGREQVKNNMEAGCEKFEWQAEELASATESQGNIYAGVWHALQHTELARTSAK